MTKLDDYVGRWELSQLAGHSVIGACRRSVLKPGEMVDVIRWLHRRQAAARDLYEEMAVNPTLTRSVAAWVLAHPAPWLTVPVHLQAAVIAHMQAGVATGGAHTPQSQCPAIALIQAWNSGGPLRGETPTDPAENPTPEPWRHPVICSSLLSLCDPTFIGDPIVATEAHHD